nr:unnamed protein product [Callosobruchus chinensis]
MQCREGQSDSLVIRP